jgi:[ribosomal protein S18]-alanine N-acetyltransferase
MSAVLKNNREVELTYRPLTEDDLPRVVEIEHSAYVFPWTFGNFRDSLYSGYICTGVWCESRLVGYTIIMPALEEAHLLNIAVDSAWQGQGIGTRVLTDLIERAKATTCEVIYLEVRPSNIAALRLYERFNFKQLGLRRDYYPAVTGREDAFFLGLNIKAPLFINKSEINDAF